MMIKIGLINTYVGVILGHMLISIPYSVNIFISFFKGINNNLEDVALTLGCGQGALYKKIIFPI